VTYAPGDHGPSHGETADRELVVRLARGDHSALAAVYDRYGRACYSLARRILGGDALAEDVVQDVFLALWRDASRYDERQGSFATYLMAMTHHKAVDAVRREDTRRRRRAPVEVLEARGDTAIDVVAEVWQGVRGRHVRAALAELPAEQREPLLLAYYGGYSQREIAGLTEIPLGTVKTRMLSGMRRLRRALEVPLADRDAGSSGRPPPPDSAGRPRGDGPRDGATGGTP
jgi:RNA polymerase sigma-70 factor (ECF subfamily)